MESNLIAIIRGVHPNDVVDIVTALEESGINSVEVSLSDEEKGLECIRQISKHFGERIRLGVGTVITERQVDLSVEAGAKYIITPGWDRELAKYVLFKNLILYPGVFTAGEIAQATALGIDVVKLFPADTLGTKYIKSLRGPFPKVKIMAVGGVSLENITEYKEAGCSYFAIGSELIPRGATKEHTEKIKENAVLFQKELNKGVM